MAAGVRLADPARFDQRGELRCGSDVEIDVGCIFEGTVELGDGVRIGAYCVVRNARIAAGATIRPYTHIDGEALGASVGAGAVVGPFAACAPGAVLGADVHVGNFVEIKNSTLGDGAKANHLAYLGDADVGERVNYGAGSITANYDGANKHRTTIGADAHIGSNCVLVAPVEVGDGATIGGGSTITKDAPAGELTVARARQSDAARLEAAGEEALTRRRERPQAAQPIAATAQAEVGPGLRLLGRMAQQERQREGDDHRNAARARARGRAAAERRVVAEQRRRGGAAEGEDAARRAPRRSRASSAAARPACAAATARAWQTPRRSRVGAAARDPDRAQHVVEQLLLLGGGGRIGAVDANGSPTTSQSALAERRGPRRGSDAIAARSRRSHAAPADRPHVDGPPRRARHRRCARRTAAAPSRARRRASRCASGIAAALRRPDADAHLAQHRALPLTPAHRRPVGRPTIEAHDDRVLALPARRRVVARRTPTCAKPSRR